MENTVNIAFFDLLMQADIVIKIILFILVLGSLWSWAIVFDKVFKFRILNVKTAKFDKLFWSGKMLEDIYKAIKDSVDHPSAMIFAAAMQEWEMSDVIAIAKSADASKKNSLKDRITNVMNVALSRSMNKLKYGLSFLLTVGSTATFFGLFGTVWGIMNSFQSISLAKDTSLIVIAPGVASALMTTIFGLFAAIPAVIFYNYYTHKISTIEEEMENFSEEVITILSRELDQ